MTRMITVGLWNYPAAAKTIKKYYRGGISYYICGIMYHKAVYHII